MLFQNVAIAGLAHIDAPHSLTSADINARLKPTMDRLGIRTDVLGDIAGAAHVFGAFTPFDEGGLQAELRQGGHVEVGWGVHGGAGHLGKERASGCPEPSTGEEPPSDHQRRTDHTRM